MQLEDESKAYALTAVIGLIDVGDLVLVNTTAVELGLGTGGWHVVHSIQSRTERHALNGGQVLKARYLSEQLEVDPHISDRTDLVGARILLCVLHSHFGAVSVALKITQLGIPHDGPSRTSVASQRCSGEPRKPRSPQVHCYCGASLWWRLRGSERRLSGSRLCSTMVAPR